MFPVTNHPKLAQATIETHVLWYFVAKYTGNRAQHHILALQFVSFVIIDILLMQKYCENDIFHMILCQFMV